MQLECLKLWIRWCHAEDEKTPRLELKWTILTQSIEDEKVKAQHRFVG
jgi:hypothetical protein